MAVLLLRLSSGESSLVSTDAEADQRRIFLDASGKQTIADRQHEHGAENGSRYGRCAQIEETDNAESIILNHASSGSVNGRSDCGHAATNTNGHVHHEQRLGTANAGRHADRDNNRQQNRDAAGIGKEHTECGRDDDNNQKHELRTIATASKLKGKVAYDFCKAAFEYALSQNHDRGNQERRRARQITHCLDRAFEDAANNKDKGYA